MTLQELQSRALEIRQMYERFEKEKWGREWTVNDLAMGFIGDLGDLIKLMQSKEGIRPAIDDIDAALEHELADCLWCVFVIANKYGLDVEKTFMRSMKDLETKIKNTSLTLAKGVTHE